MARIIGPRVAREFVSRNRMWLYVIGFISFWLAITMQSAIRDFWTDRVSADILNFTTILSMWIFAAILFPTIGAMLLIHFKFRR